MAVGFTTGSAPSKSSSGPYTSVMVAADNNHLPPDPSHFAVVSATRIANEIARSMDVEEDESVE